MSVKSTHSRMCDRIAIMFAKRTRFKRLSGVALLLAIAFLAFGHTFAPSSIAFADDRAHRDEVRHAPDSEDHSPCPTELHQTIRNRTTPDDSSTSLGDFKHCAFAATSSDFIYPSNYLVSARVLDGQEIPPRLPLEQKTILLI